ERRMSTCDSSSTSATTPTPPRRAASSSLSTRRGRRPRRDGGPRRTIRDGCLLKSRALSRFDPREGASRSRRVHPLFVPHVSSATRAYFSPCPFPVFRHLRRWHAEPIPVTAEEVGRNLGLGTVG